MSAIPDDSLRAYFVWIPMLPDDNRKAAEASSRRFAHSRAAHYWDGERRLGRRMATALDLKPENSLTVSAVGGKQGIAWDVYLLYGRGATAIEQPDFWMHQLDTDLAPRLDPRVLGERIRTLLEH